MVYILGGKTKMKDEYIIGFNEALEKRDEHIRQVERKRILELIDKLDDYGMEVVRTFKRELKIQIKQEEKQK